MPPLLRPAKATLPTLGQCVEEFNFSRIPSIVPICYRGKRMDEHYSASGHVYVVDDDPAMRESLSAFLRSAGLCVEAFEDANAFMALYDPAQPGCLVLDVQMPKMSGLDLQEKLLERGAL